MQILCYLGEAIQIWIRYPRPQWNRKDTSYVINNQMDRDTTHKGGEEITLSKPIHKELIDLRPAKFMLSLSLNK